MVNKTVVSLCISGLANRIDSILGGLYLSQLFNCDFKFVWEPDAECMCEYSDIFDSYTTRNITYQELEGMFYKQNHSTFCGMIDRKNFLISINEEWRRYNSVPRKKKFLMRLPETHWFAAATLDKNINDIRDKNLIIYHNALVPDYIPYTQLTSLLLSLKIKKYICAEATQFITRNNININTTGILLRKHFGVDVCSLFDVNESYYVNLIDSNKDKNFYLMSDLKICEDLFNNKTNVCIYPKRSYVYWDTKYAHWRRDKNSIIDAFIGLLILSKTNIITPSTNNKGFRSSFSELSHLYQKIKLEKLTI